MKDAVRILKSGGLVAFPTETVYGLGADATSSQAVSRIFAAKGRPATNPLIVHVADIERAKRCSVDWPTTADRLATAFWPGPLALILPKNPIIVDQATAGRKTVALRAPDHPIAQQLLREFDGPIAAPSANRSTRISPTTAEHVRRELGDRVDLILDGGPCRVGIESTVLDLTATRPIILRPGGISRQKIETIIGPVELFRKSVDESQSATSPGQQQIHYSPHTPAFRYKKSAELIDGLRVSGRCAILSMRSPGASEMEIPPLPIAPLIIQMPLDADGYAHRFYAALRQADDASVAAIWVEMPPDQPEWLAVRDRIARATRAVALQK